MKKLFNYINESRKELKKVVWPNKQEVIKHTLLVITISIAVAAFIGIADFILNQLVSIII